MDDLHAALRRMTDDVAPISGDEAREVAAQRRAPRVPLPALLVAFVLLLGVVSARAIGRGGTDDLSQSMPDAHVPGSTWGTTSTSTEPTTTSTAVDLEAVDSTAAPSSTVPGELLAPTATTASTTSTSPPIIVTIAPAAPTTLAETTTEPSTTTTTEAPRTIVLRGDGIDELRFGTLDITFRAALGRRVGSDSDSTASYGPGTYVPPDYQGSVIHDYLSIIDPLHPELEALLMHTERFIHDLGKVTEYVYRRPAAPSRLEHPFATAEGITVDMTRDDVVGRLSATANTALLATSCYQSLGGLICLRFGTDERVVSVAACGATSSESGIGTPASDTSERELVTPTCPSAAPPGTSPT